MPPTVDQDQFQRSHTLEFLKKALRHQNRMAGGRPKDPAAPPPGWRPPDLRPGEGLPGTGAPYGGAAGLGLAAVGVTPEPWARDSWQEVGRRRPGICTFGRVPR